MQRYFYNMLGINLHSVYTESMVDSYNYSNLDVAAMTNVIFNKVDNQVRQFQFSRQWGVTRMNQNLFLHSLYHWILDSPFRKQSYYQWALTDLIRSEDAIARRIYHDLHYDGIAMVDDWGLTPQYLSELERIFSETISSNDVSKFSSTSNGTVVTVRRYIEALERFLADSEQGNVSLIRAVKAYLGSEVLLSGYKITELGGNLQGTKDYIAGHWHHDRVGRRLKLFVFLNDVDCEFGRPTLMAASTNLLEYWRTNSYYSSRFEESYVDEKYNVKRACGKRGGGFIFDTHSIHRAGVELRHQELEKNVPRLTVIAEYHNVIKCHLNEKYQLGLPCPSGDQYIVNRRL